MRAAGAQQHLCHRQAHQFRARQRLGVARTALPGTDHMIVDQHVQRDQEGIQASFHKRSWMPSSASGQPGTPDPA
jgi:hypothetical protein